MTYTKQGFQDGQVLKAEHLIKIEDALISTQESATNNTETVSTLAATQKNAASAIMAEKFCSNGNGSTPDAAPSVGFSAINIYGKTFQDGIPTPEAPVEITHLGQGNDLEIRTVGKNLLPPLKEVVLSNNITYTPMPDGGILVVGGVPKVDGEPTGSDHSYCKLVENEVYPAGSYILTGGMNSAQTIYAVVGNFTYVSKDGSGASFGLSEPTAISIIIKINNGQSVNKVFYPMLRLAADEDATYEPYMEETSMTFALPNGLPGIPTKSENCTYIDENGQHWVSDEIDFERGVYIQRCATETFNGTKGGMSFFQGFCRIGWKEGLWKRPGVNSCGFCDKLPYTTVYNETEGSGIGNNGTYFSILGTTIGCSDLAQWKAWLAANPLTITYIIASPVEHPLSEEEIALYNALKVEKYITNSFGADMFVKYVADTQKYFDTMVANLTAQIQLLNERVTELENLYEA